MPAGRNRRLRLFAVGHGILLSYLACAPAWAAPPQYGEVPEAVREARRHLLDADLNELTFRSMDRLFDTREVTRSGPIWNLPRQDRAPDFTYALGGQNLRAEDFAQRNRTNAMLIMKHGRIVHEEYNNLSNADTRFISFSMAKSITSMLIGIALHEGKIRSLDDTIGSYITELRGSDYGRASIRQVMRMRSGIAFDERYDFGVDSQAQQVFEHAIVRNETRFADMAVSLKRRTAGAEAFNYSTMDTAVLGWMLERAVGEPLSTYMTSRLWEPLGAEAGGFWIADGPPQVGRALNGMGFNATLRDYARLGEMMRLNGRAAGRPVIPEDWVKLSTASTRIDSPGGVLPPQIGYAYQWWTIHGTGTYFALGLQGQFIYVDPASETVIVLLSYWPPGDDHTYMEEAMSFLQAACAWQG
jgi:CubicO group peptidase (beta-lactamase class C family)